MKDKDIKFLGYILPRDKVVGSVDGDIDVEEFIDCYNYWNMYGRVGCTICGFERKTFFAFVSKVAGAEGELGICKKCLGRLNTRELVIDNKGSSMSLPVVRVAYKSEATGWVTEADIVLGDLTESSLEYRQKLKVWIDPELESEREANRKQGIYYIVEIAGYKFRFYHLKDVLRFSHVRDRFYCDIEYFLETLENGEVWVEGDVSVWQVQGSEVDE